MKPKVLIRLSKRFLIVAALIVLVVGSSAAMVPVRAQDDSKIVYVAICTDSEMWGGMGPYIGSSNPHPTMDVREYSRTVPMTVAAAFDSDFRNSHQDSFGNIFKLSWFAEMDYLIAQSNFVWADGSPAGVSGYTAIRDLLVNNWGTEIQAYGDSIEYHHHFVIYDGTWQRYNNGPDAGYPEYQMYALDHMIIDDNFYPSTWRSGDWIMPPALSSWLEQWMPFDYTPTTGVWYPVHPSGMDRWQTACSYDTPDTPTGVNEAFAYARDHGSAIYSVCTHDIADMQSQVAWLQENLNIADANEAAYPNVSFKYVTAQQAMQLALGFTDFTPPTFTITPSGGTYTIVSSEPLWKNHPYIALKYADGTYGHMSAIPAGTNTWTVKPSSGVSIIGVAGSDLYGNPGTASTLEVGPGKPYSTIQSAITAATAGSTILVYPGTYQEEVTINKQLNITSVGGAGQTFIDGTGVALNSPGLVKITAPGDVVFSGFTIRNALAAGGVTVGIFSESSMPEVTYTISYNNIWGTNDPDNAEDYGFYSYSDSANVIFSHNLITQTGANNILFELHTGATEISYNTLDAGVYGSDAIFIMTYDGQDITALQNESYNTFNMGTGGPFDNDHRASAISINTWPIAPDAKFTNVVIQGNTINNLESYRRGIAFWNGGGGGGGAIAPQVENNDIIGLAGRTESYGIDFIGAGAATNAAILNNWIYHCAYGVYLRTTDCAPGAQITYNDILGNTVGLDMVGSSDVDAQYNYWGDPTGPYNAVSNPSGLGNPVTANVNYKPYLTSPNRLAWLIIQKKDQAGNIINLPGATFTISPNPYGAGTLTVVDNDANDANPANGIIDLYVPPGTYTITETVAPAGYEVDPTPQDATISSSAAVTITFTNKLSELIILKKDQAGNIITTAGATFSISPNPFTGSATPLTVVDNDVSDSNPAIGTIDLKNVLLATYTVTETAAPAGYEVDPTPQGVTISSSAAVTISFTNKLGELIIQKKDAFDNIINLPGAVFTVSPNPYGAGTLTVVDNDANDVNPASGIIDLKNVPLGTYTVAETVAPAGFEVDPAPYPVTVTSSATVTISFINSIRGDVNSDGKVDIFDLRAVAAYYDKTSADPEWPAASKFDLVQNNEIDLYDLVFVASNYGFTYP